MMNPRGSYSISPPIPHAAHKFPCTSSKRLGMTRNSASGRSRDRGRRSQQQLWVNTEPDAGVGRRVMRQGRGSLTEFSDDVTYGVDLGDQFRE